MASRTQEQEPRYGCPVCLGVIMAKVAPSKDVDVQLDYCTRCGGMWLDQGEAEQLKMCRPKALSSVIELSKSAYLMKCHSCQATMDRNEVRGNAGKNARLAGRRMSYLVQYARDSCGESKRTRLV